MFVNLLSNKNGAKVNLRGWKGTRAVASLSLLGHVGGQDWNISSFSCSFFILMFSFSSSVWSSEWVAWSPGEGPGYASERHSSVQYILRSTFLSTVLEIVCNIKRKEKKNHTWKSSKLSFVWMTVWNLWCIFLGYRGVTEARVGEENRWYYKGFFKVS